MGTSARPAKQDHHLLETEVDAIFGLDYHIVTDDNDHSVATLKQQDIHAVVAWSPCARFTAVSDALLSYKAVLENNLTQEVYDQERKPEALTHLCDSLGLSHKLITGGPSYVFPREFVSSQHLDSADVSVITSSTTHIDVHEIERPSTWEQDEWSKLLSGNLGPWAFAITGNGNDGNGQKKVVSVCFSARRTATAAEAGVWTHDAHRGRGLAPAVTAAWATLEGTNKQILYYSLSGVNPASSSVARKLGLQPLGWVWKVSRE